MTTEDSDPFDVLVVGAGAAGLSTVEALRRQGHPGRIALLGSESWAPYDRPPLSKQVLAGTWTPDRTRLRSDDALASLDVDLLLGDVATGLDAATRTVTTAAGRMLAADAVVLATGATPRMLPGQAQVAGVHVVRTLDDALRLRAELRPGRRLVVVGEGVLGTEVAATARTLGVDVTVTGPQALPMAAQLGPLVAGVLAEMHREHGVEFRLGVATDGFVVADGRVTGVLLADGDVLPADVVAVALGAVPEVGWLTGSGLVLDNGIVCDSACRAAPGIYAVGDVARFHHSGLGRLIRLENRTNATEQAAAVAAGVLGAERDYLPVPYLWTDQYESKLQVHGLTGSGADATVVEGDVAKRRFVVTYHHAGAFVGVLGWDMPKPTLALRRELAPTFVPPVPGADLLSA